MTRSSTTGRLIGRRTFIAGAAALAGMAPAAGLLAQDMPTLRVAYAQGIQANFYHALQNGLFEKHGVRVEGTKFDSGPALITALVSGSVDVGYFGAPALISANARGANLRIFSVANLAGTMAALYVRPGSGITSVEDLVGRSVATTQNTVAHIFMQVAFSQAGIDSSEVEVQLLDPQALVAGYVRGNIDAIWMFASAGARLISNGAEIVPSTSATALGLEDQGNFIADETFIAANLDTLMRFQAAVDEATPITNEDRQAALGALEGGIGLVGEQAEIILDHMPVAGVTAADIADPDSPASLVSPDGLQRILGVMQDAMVEIGMLDTAQPADSFITDAVVSAM
mgnify:CR=1 FL=1